MTGRCPATRPNAPKTGLLRARGHAYFRVVGKTRKQLCGEPGCFYNVGTKFNTRLPASPFFEIGPGKNIDWTQFLPDE